MNNTKEITTDEEIIDSRSVIDRIEYLQSLRDDFQSDNELDDYPGFQACEQDSKWNEWDILEESFELNNLVALQDEAEGYSDDWQYGSTLIREDYFTEYAEQLVKDIGDLPQDLPSYIEDNIDWDGVAEDLKVDYTEVDFDGTIYFVR